MASGVLLVLAAALGAAGAAPTPAADSSPRGFRFGARPVVGILTQPGGHQKGAPSADVSYVAASYVKWVEAGGGRPVPIHHERVATDDAALAAALAAVDAVVFPGGDSDTSEGTPLRDAATRLLRAAVKENVPVWGTCMGFQLLAVIVAEDDGVLTRFAGVDVPASLQPTTRALSSELMRSLPVETYKELLTAPVAYENHHWGVGRPAWENSTRLTSFFGEPVSYSNDANGVPYVSTIEAKEAHVYGVQWHPEKNSFEWKASLHIPHGPGGVRVTQATANFLVEKAYEAKHRTVSEEELSKLVFDNFPITYTTPLNSSFVSVYFFPMQGAAPPRSHARRLLRGPR